MTFVVQIWRCNEWRCLTAIRATASSPADEPAAIKRARNIAMQQLRDWSSHFAGDRLRVWEGA